MQHKLGKEKTTRPYRPFRLVLLEEFPSRTDARVREKYLKTGTGKEYIKNEIIRWGGEIGRRTSLRS